VGDFDGRGEDDVEREGEVAATRDCIVWTGVGP
jgi:hypothetical protein